MSKLREIYKGSFKGRRNKHDVVTAYDGGYMDFSTSSFDPSTVVPTAVDTGYGSGYNPSTDPNVAGYTGSQDSSLAAPAATGLDQNYLSTINAELAADPTGENAAASFDSSKSKSGSSSGSSAASSAAGGALGTLLKALGLGSGNTSAQGITALAGLLSAAGQYKQNSAYAPTFAPPALFGGTSGTTSGNTAGIASTGYGPAGGYNYANYKGLVAGAPGLGYAPQTATTPTIPNYYTYGQGPQQSFFTTTPSSATQPTAMKKGGKVSTPQRFAMGGFNTGMMPPVHPNMGTITPSMGVPSANPMAGGITTSGPSNPTGTPSFGAMPAQRGAQVRPAVPATMPPQQTHTQPMPGRAFANGGSAAPQASSSSFTSQVPQNLSGVLSGMRKASTPSHAPPLATGGALASVSRHVKGPGDGTNDKIPARLSPGEFVISADVVSGIGNGDNGAGARKLDAFMKNVRKHKAENGSKGKLPANARPVASYLGK
jgi:hypothetical protein